MDTRALAVPTRQLIQRRRKVQTDVRVGDLGIGLGFRRRKEATLSAGNKQTTTYRNLSAVQSHRPVNGLFFRQSSKRLVRCSLPIEGSQSPGHSDRPSSLSEKSSGLKLMPALATIATFAVIWVSPTPAGLSVKAWHLAAIFAATVVGIIAQPLPLGAVALAGLGVACATSTISFQAAFSAFSAEVPWLILIAMFLSKALSKTGLGQRLAIKVISIFGGSTLGLTYSLVLSEALLAPAIPSVAARAGGIFLPLIQSLSESCGSKSSDGTAGKLGAFLMTVCFQCSAVTSGMFLTANHPNPLSASLAEAATGKAITWNTWALAAVPPGVVSLLLIPLVVYFIYPPESTSSKGAQQMAQSQLKSMGSMGSKEMTTAVVLGMTVALWIWGHLINVSPTIAALGGLMLMLATDVITWDDCLSHKSAWNTLCWFSALVALASQLRTTGLVDYFTNHAAGWLAGLQLSWPFSFLILVLIYFYSHFFFASNLAHVSAMFSAFLALALASGTPPMLAALSLCFFSNMMGGITHYGMSHAPAFFGTGYVPLSRWWINGGIISVVNLAIWLTCGSLWWKIIGLW